MANNVYNLIYVRQAHKNAIQALENVFETLGDNALAYSEILPEWEDDRYPSHEWCEKNIGAKNAVVERVDIDIKAGVANIDINSEWTPVRPFFKRLCNVLEEIDEDIEIGMLYTDEFHQFDGHVIYAQGDYVVDQHNVEELVKLDTDNGEKNEEKG